MTSDMKLSIRHPRDLAPQLKSLRRSQGLSQGELGARLGVTQARVAQIEANPGAVSMDQILRLLQLLGVELVLQGGAPSPDAVDWAEAPATEPATEPAPEPLPPAPILDQPAPRGAW